jgi:hypothetical protein
MMTDMKTKLADHWKRRITLMDVPHWFLFAQTLFMGLLAILILAKLVG